MTELERYARTLAGALNDAFDQAMADADDLLRINGATEFERQTCLEACRVELAAWRTRTFALMFAHYQRDGQTIQ